MEESHKTEVHEVVHKGVPATHRGEQVVHTETVTECIKSKGAFAGESPVKILDKALRWWKKELDELENIVWILV